MNLIETIGCGTLVAVLATSASYEAKQLASDLNNVMPAVAERNDVMNDETAKFGYSLFANEASPEQLAVSNAVAQLMAVTTNVDINLPSIDVNVTNVDVDAGYTNYGDAFYAWFTNYAQQLH